MGRPLHLLGGAAIAVAAVCGSTGVVDAAGHAGITITTDAGFQTCSCVTSGSGTASSPAMGEAEAPELQDAFIVGAATKAEHYEMVGYADLIDGAETMKLRPAVRLLTENREQEVRTARKLEGAAPRIAKAAA